MSTLHIMIGPPASGKSTVAKSFGCAVVSSDELREFLTGDAGDLSADDQMWPMFHQRVAQILAYGHDVVADATHLSAMSRHPYLTLGPDVNKIAHIMCTSLPACKLRNELRPRRVPEHVIDDMFAKLDALVIGDLITEGFAVDLRGTDGGVIGV